jgi:hypothetical protein
MCILLDIYVRTKFLLVSFQAFTAGVIQEIIFYIIHHVGPCHSSLSIYERTEAACFPITSEQTYSSHSAVTKATCFFETSELPSVSHSVLTLKLLVLPSSSGSRSQKTDMYDISVEMGQ